MADDLLIIGHRHSEWTGLGPILEEDISFSSMAQDKIGQSQALFQLLYKLGEPEADTNAFTRNANQFCNAQFVELPNDEYDFSTVRHFLYDHADQLRFEMLAHSSYEPLAKLARKVKGELKYHVFHANTWMVKLSQGTEESRARMQSALNASWNYALGLFEESKFEKELIAAKVFEGEVALKSKWLSAIIPFIEKAGLKLPPEKEWNPVNGGRKNFHTEHLELLVKEMGEVFRVEPHSQW